MVGLPLYSHFISVAELSNKVIFISPYPHIYFHIYIFLLVSSFHLYTNSSLTHCFAFKQINKFPRYYKILLCLSNSSGELLSLAVSVPPYSAMIICPLFMFRTIFQPSPAPVLSRSASHFWHYKSCHYPFSSVRNCDVVLHNFIDTYHMFYVNLINVILNAPMLFYVIA